jgi:lipopolysaccharide assembly protein A
MATLYFAFFIAVLTAVFALQNTTRVAVRLLFWQYETSLVLVILGAAALGALLASLLAIGSAWRRARKFRNLSAAVVSQEARSINTGNTDRAPSHLSFTRDRRQAAK